MVISGLLTLLLLIHNSAPQVILVIKFLITIKSYFHVFSLQMTAE